jgi:hypothetical protein
MITHILLAIPGCCLIYELERAGKFSWVPNRKSWMKSKGAKNRLLIGNDMFFKEGTTNTLNKNRNTIECQKKVA